MTIVAEGDEQTLEQIIKQLYKQIDVLKVFDLPAEEAIERELALIKVQANEKTRAEITQIAEMFKASIADVSGDSIVIEVSAEKEKVENMQKLLEKFGIQELVRTGKIALEKGPSTGSGQGGKK